MIGIVPGLKSTAYRVAKSNWNLFNGQSAATLVLTGTKPTVPFKLKITLSGTDYAGTVTVNAEVITFTQASTKITVAILTALPTITTNGLNCTVKVECVDSAGAMITSEIKTAFLCRWMDSTQMYQNATGEWSQSLAQVLTTDSLCVVGGEIEYLSLRYVIKKVIAFSKLSGREFLRRLYL